MQSLPDFKGPIEGYVVNFVTKNLWRVKRIMARDDVMQDAYMVYLRVKDKYPNLDTPQHFMALFKTSWTRHFTDLANADTQSRVLTSLTTRSDDGSEMDLDPVGDLDNEGALSIKIRQAPREVTAVLNLFLSAPQELLDVALSNWTGQDKRCKTGGSERINKLLGLPSHVDSLQAVHDYFH